MKASVIANDYASASLDASYRALVKYMERNRLTVESKLQTLYRWFAVGVVLLGVEVLCWLYDLTLGAT